MLAAKLQALEASDSRVDKARITTDSQLSRLAMQANATALFDAQYARYLQRSRLDLERAERQHVTLNASLSALNQTIRRQGQDLITQQQLTREVEVARGLYEQFLTQLNATLARQGVQQADSRILSHAVVPLRPASPRKAMILGMAGLIGLLLGTGAVLAHMLYHPGLQSAQAIEKMTGRPVIAILPWLNGRHVQEGAALSAAMSTPAYTRAVDHLRSALTLHDKRDQCQVTLLTAATMTDQTGAATLALGHAFERINQATVIVSVSTAATDMLDLLLDGANGGLKDVLEGRATIKQATQRIEPLGVDLLRIMNGDRVSDILMSSKLTDLIDDLQETYDHVILHTDAIQTAPDVRKIARCADRILVAVHWGQTTHASLQDALRQFQMCGQGIDGLVLSQTPRRSLKALMPARSTLMAQRLLSH